MARRARWAEAGRELRTVLTGVDPGLGRLRLACTATAAMALAAGASAVLVAATGEPVTVVVFAAVLAMVSNLSVTEPELGRRRATIALMAPPAAAATAAGTLLAPHRVVAAAVFVLVMAVAVYVRRYGPRGFALGMAAFFAYFFTQFLGAGTADLPWLLAAAGIGIGSTLLLGGWVFAERPSRVLDRLLRAFRSHVHALVEAVADALTADPDGADPPAVERALADVRRVRARLNDTALLVADRIGHLGTAPPRDLPLQVLDAELAAERLAVSARRLLVGDEPVDPVARAALVAGVHALGRATATGTPPERAVTLLDAARRSVAALAAADPGAGTGAAGIGPGGIGPRTQRVAFAVTRCGDAFAAGRRTAGLDEPARAAAAPTATDSDTTEPDTDPDAPEPDDDGRELSLAARQAVQVAVATSLAIVLGEVVSPSRWYWAVIAAFVVFAGTASRGDVLARGSQRVVGTVGGVAAGMGLAALVGDDRVAAAVLLFVCVFLALYLVRVSQALLAFWITAVLALLYGLIGQFSTDTLVTRITETAVGAALGMLAGYLVLPKRTREAFTDALDAATDAADATLAAAVDRLTGHETPQAPVELARELDEAVATLRARARPLAGPVARWRDRSDHDRALRVLTAVDHYARGLARYSDTVGVPAWEPTLRPAADRVRANLDGLRLLLHGAPPRSVPIASAEELVDAAEGVAAGTADHRLRADLLHVVRLLRRIDQAVVGFAVDLGAGDPAEARS